MQNFGIQNACKLCFYNKTDGKLALYFPSANSFAMSVSGEIKQAMAQGSPVITWQSGRKGTVKIESELTSPRFLAIILGAIETKESSGNFTQIETGRIDSTTATYSIKEAPATGTLSVFLTEDDIGEMRYRVALI